MDEAAITQALQAMKRKAKAARTEGQRAIAATFRAGAARLSRRLRVLRRKAGRVVAKAES